MVEVRQTATFSKWFDKLSDLRARALIDARIARDRAGHLGDAKSVGKGVSELRIGYGPGYRLYFPVRGSVVVILLCGGTKDTQQGDIERAVEIAKNLE